MPAWNRTYLQFWRRLRAALSWFLRAPHPPPLSLCLFNITALGSASCICLPSSAPPMPPRSHERTALHAFRFTIPDCPGPDTTISHCNLCALVVADAGSGAVALEKGPAEGVRPACAFMHGVGAASCPDLAPLRSLFQLQRLTQACSSLIACALPGCFPMRKISRSRMRNSQDRSW